MTRESFAEWMKMYYDIIRKSKQLQEMTIKNENEA